MYTKKKQEAAPELDIAKKVARKANDKAAKYEHFLAPSLWALTLLVYQAWSY